LFVLLFISILFSCQAILYAHVGMLRTNLTLMHQPVIEFIASFANGMSRNDFTNIWWPIVTYVTEKSTSNETVEVAGVVIIIIIFEITCILDETSSTLLTDLCEICNDEKSNRTETEIYAHLRQQLWTCMSSFAHLCESSTRIFVPLMLHIVKYVLMFDDIFNFVYLSEEYCMIGDGGQTRLVNLTKDVDDKIENETIDDETQQNDAPSDRRKSCQQLLLSTLAICAKFNDPRSAYKHDEVEQMYYRVSCISLFIFHKCFSVITATTRRRSTSSITMYCDVQSENSISLYVCLCYSNS
jgi:hypothetical protein